MLHSTDSIPILDSVSEIAPCYDAWLCDVWGVIHNGERSFPRSIDACQKFRSAGGRVVLLTNAPRPWTSVQPILDRLDVARDCYDAIVTSGDVTRGLIGSVAGHRIFHLGPERDKPIFKGLDVELTDIDTADGVLCTGLYDDTSETPDDYAELFDRMLERGLELICANPDHVVERGDQIIYCAGALANRYEEAGGKVKYAGKPYLPIYDSAMAIIEKLEPERFNRSRVIAIGDGLKTDMAGAKRAGLDALYVASGIHVSGHSDDNPVTSSVIAELFADIGFRPVAAQSRLAW